MIFTQIVDSTILATCDPKLMKNPGPKVAKYTVLVEDFEKASMEILNFETRSQTDENAKVIIIVDEIGKMECCSEKFCQRIREIFDRKGVHKSLQFGVKC